MKKISKRGEALANFFVNFYTFSIVYESKSTFSEDYNFAIVLMALEITRVSLSSLVPHSYSVFNMITFASPHRFSSLSIEEVQALMDFLECALVVLGFHRVGCVCLWRV